MTQASPLVRIVTSPLSPKGAGDEFKGFPESPNAVVDHDGDRLNGDTECRHPDQDSPNPSTAVVDDDANHWTISGGKRRLRQDPASSSSLSS